MVIPNGNYHNNKLKFSKNQIILHIILLFIILEDTLYIIFFLLQDPLINKQKKELLEKGVNWLNQIGIKSLYNVLDNIDLDIGVHIINSCGHGILTPNIVLIGYKHDWFNCMDDDIQTYLNILKYMILYVIKNYVIKKIYFY